MAADAEQCIDEPLLIDTPRGVLVGMAHLPAGEARGPGVVFCNAFGEERKSSALTMARLARAVAGVGFPALRFDYYGCGDSEGDFADATVATRLDDIKLASQFLCKRAGCDHVCLLGLRLGATIAAGAAEQASNCVGLVLIEPITDGAQYFGGELRRKLIRQMITTGRGGASRREMLDALDDDAILDLDGFAIRGATLKELTGLGIRTGEVAFSGPMLVCQVHFKDTPKPELEAPCAAYRAAGADVDFRALVLPPFWNRIEVTLADKLNETVASWLTALIAS